MQWRQRSMIFVKECNLFPDCPNDAIALAISHDCDLEMVSATIEAKMIGSVTDGNPEIHSDVVLMLKLD